MFTFLYLPALLGLVMVIFAKPIGIGFCRAGKAQWKALTFGKTDLAMFYPEDKAPVIMRVIGCGVLVMSLSLIFVAGNPFRGPGRFKAMSEAKDYLTRVYGSSSGPWNFSASRLSTDDSVIIVEYRFGGRVGSLRGQWLGDAYEFTEIHDASKKSPKPPGEAAGDPLERSPKR
jgi:hypothetical protein